MTRLPNGDVLIDMTFTPEERAALNADAARAGVTVNELIKRRVLEGPEIARRRQMH